VILSQISRFSKSKKVFIQWEEKKDEAKITWLAAQLTGWLTGGVQPVLATWELNNFSTVRYYFSILYFQD
jgi:hypothetical protein